MHLKPRNPRRDRLVNEALAVYSYFQIGAAISVCVIKIYMQYSDSLLLELLIPVTLN